MQFLIKVLSQTVEREPNFLTDLIYGKLAEILYFSLKGSMSQLTLKKQVFNLLFVYRNMFI